MRVRAVVERRQEVIDSGWPVGTATVEVLYRGPAELEAPRRDWERAAALEGVLSGRLLVDTAADLSRATHAVVEGTAYRVGSAMRDGYVWELLLQGAA